MLLERRAQQAFGKNNNQPEIGRPNTKWKSAQIRNDTEIVDNALKIADKLPLDEFFRLVAPVFGWNEEKIKELAEARQTEDAARLFQIGGLIPPVLNATNEVISSNGGNT